MRLYYAFETQPADNTIQPYLFAATINGIERTDQQMLGKYRKVVVTFGDVRP